MRTLVVTTMLLLSACASRGPGPEINAVVQDESARQAAASSAQAGDGSKTALEVGAEAAAREKDVGEPPV